MAGLRKGHCYTKVIRSYTRKSKFKKKSFVKGVPDPKVVKYDMGDLSKEFPREVKLVTKEAVQVRHNAIESSRLLINRHLSSKLGNNFKFKIRAYPHHILRENKMLEGAGADRMQKGMQHSFGKAVGTAAQLKKGQPFISVFVEDKDVEFVSSVLKAGIKKLPGKYRVV